MKNLILTLSLLVFVFPLTACFPDSADTIQKKQTEQMVLQSVNQVGMPAIVNFQEKRMAKQIYEMRDTNISTHAYIMNEMQGCLVYLGPSVGFGLPYATQYSNPMKLAGMVAESTAIPQPEPNGLFMPDSADASWILLKDPNGTEVKPVYVEPKLIVSPFKITGKECK